MDLFDVVDSQGIVDELFEFLNVVETISLEELKGTKIMLYADGNNYFAHTGPCAEFICYKR